MAKIIFIFQLLFFILLLKPAPVAAQLVVNNNDISLFSSIPLEYKNSAAAFRLIQGHASVGSIIGEQQNLKSTFTFFHFGLTGYSETASKFSWFQNLSLLNYDVASFKLCYVDNGKATGLDYFAAINNKREPGKTIIAWTMPLVANELSWMADFHRKNIYEFNLALRSACNNNNDCILFDIADIESNGGQCLYYGTSGVYEALCNGKNGEPDYTDDDQHPNVLAADKAARAYWVMLAKLAGWDPGAVSPTSTPVLTQTPTPLPTIILTPTPTSNPYDLDGDGEVNSLDLKQLIENYLFTIFNRGDYIADGKINVMDLIMLILHL